MQARVGHGLQQVGDHAILDGLVDQVGMPVGRDDDHGSSRVLRDLPRGGQAIHSRHLDIKEDGIGECSPAHLHGTLTVVDHGHDIVAQRFELILQTGGDRLLVVRDDKTIRPRHRRYPSFIRSSFRHSAIECQHHRGVLTDLNRPDRFTETR